MGNEKLFSVSQTAKLTGVSVRTLHYYDKIGLLAPSNVSDAGYRFYDAASLERLHMILFYRELDFPLDEIARVLENAENDREFALVRQRRLLVLKKERLDRLICLLDSRLKGENNMSFEEFSTTDIDNAKEQYAREVRERWGNTKAFAQSEEHEKKYSRDDKAAIAKQANEIMDEFAALSGKSPEDEAVQRLVRKWQQHITDYYYDCSNEILANLGEMYTADERFAANINSHGEGTAQLMSGAIKIYCKANG